MTDSVAGAAPAPKKKKFAFKKAAWQTAPKSEDKAVDLFSHSNEFRDIVADQAQRKDEAKRRKAEEAQKRKADDECERKRRKISTEEPEKPPGSGSASSPDASRLNSNGRSETPLSPVRRGSRDTLSRRYDSLTKSSSTGSFPNESTVIDLGDSDEDDGSFRKASPTPIAQPIPVRSSKHPSSEELEEVEDPEVAAFRAAARARAAKKRAAEEAAKEAQASGEAKSAPIVQLLVTSFMSDTRPVMMKVRIDQTIGVAREAWCKRQGFTEAQTNELFLTYRNQRLFDSTTIQVLGIKVDAHGNISVPGDTNIYDDVNLPKIQVDAWTAKFKAEYDEEEAYYRAAEKKAAEQPSLYKDPTSEPEPEPEKTIKLVLVEKGQKEAGVGLTVRPDTDFGHVAAAYKHKKGIDKDQPITLIWDGDRLPPMDTIADTDLEDMDTIEVHFK